MGQSVFTFINRHKKLMLLSLLVLTLSGCSAATNEPLNPDQLNGIEYLIYPFTLLIKSIANVFNDNYGISIILITLIIRLLLLPFMVKQMKSSMDMKDKMDQMKPDLDALKEKYKDKKDQESMQAQQKEMMELYQKHGTNPFAMFGGCLPLLIQMPILLGFYYAIRRTPEIATHDFLWFSLGQTDIALTLIAVVIYYFQFKVSQMGMDEKQKKQMAFMGLLSPIMIGVISINSPAAFPLYWATGGLFLMLQTWLTKKILYAKKEISS
ncbi:membrane protein insertase YidC [Virgibacillus halodenitrificans]|uniref:membrane protein insertase YidC n=1 Tax=Virgibacillus halodenitrificans TaxID=1482 RepID=UPI001F1C0EFC|nr:membrane protein insertase YidC [Virgibacillus halodenitrificans]